MFMTLLPQFLEEWPHGPVPAQFSLTCTCICKSPHIPQEQLHIPYKKWEAAASSYLSSFQWNKLDVSMRIKEGTNQSQLWTLAGYLDINSGWSFFLETMVWVTYTLYRFRLTNYSDCTQLELTVHMYMLKLCYKHYHMYPVLKLIVRLWCQTFVMYHVVVYCMQGALVCSLFTMYRPHSH